jgi:serine/threonine protein kinase
VLTDKYKMGKTDAEQIANFFEVLLEINPARRATAEQALQHPFLTQI